MIKMLLEKLANEDITLVHEWVKHCGGRGGYAYSDVCDAKWWLRFWDANKVDLYHLLGDEMIKTMDISVTKSPDDMIEDIRLMCNGAGEQFVTSFHDMVYNYGHNRAYIIPVGEAAEAVLNERDEVYWQLTRLISGDNLRTNIYRGDDFKILARNGKDIINVTDGCKCSKVLGKIAKAFGLAGYEEFRIAHSMVLNQKMLRGKLCFSIHPMDYITMSDNDYDWTSCMSWFEGGDYRNGTIEMMNSSYVIVAYLKGDKEWHPISHLDYTWSNKKWRQLFMVTPDMLLGIKSYPYVNEDLTALCLKHLRQWAVEKMHWGPYTQNLSFLRNNQQNVIGELDPTQRYGVHLHMNWMYNDIHGDHPAYVSTDFPLSYHFNLSGPCVCIECGEVMEYPDSQIDPAFPVCHDCCDEIYCEECGEWVSREGAVEVDGCWYCEYCYGQVTVYCPCCDKDHINCDTVLLCADGENTQHTIEVCYDCRHQGELLELFQTDRIKEKRFTWSYHFYVDLETAKEESYPRIQELFDIGDDEFEEILENMRRAKEEAASDSRMTSLDEELPF